MVVNHSDHTQKRKKLYAKRVRAAIKKKHNATRLQTTTLDKLYLLACKAPDLKSLYALRTCVKSRILTRQNYSKFTILIDRLMETL